MMFEKLKNLNKKWYLLLVLIIFFGAGCGLYVKFYHIQQFQKNMQASTGEQIARTVEQDLLYLDTTSTLKLSPDQAKAILPLIEEMSTSFTNSLPTINDGAKKVYEILTPAQYQALINYEPVTGNVEKDRQEGKKNNRLWDNRKFDNTEHNAMGIADPKADALKDIVIKMLKERSI